MVADLKTDLSEIFVLRAVAGFLAGVKASHHSTDKESRDRLDLGVTSFCHIIITSLVFL